jgi:hypothetical protein
MGRARAEQIVNWATLALEADYETPSLRILAAWLQPLDPADVEYYVQQALIEMEWPIPDKNAV